MDHGAVVKISYTRRPMHRRVALAVVAAAMLLAIIPGSSFAAGATLVEPADGKHFDYLDLAPMVQFDPGTNEQPKWVLLATDAAMTQTVRYCRQFVWASSAGAYHWGCNRWAVGVDASGNDRLMPLESDKVYYWQVVSKIKGTDTETLSAVRSFAIDKKPDSPSISDISEQVHGSAISDGTQLNLGAAAFVNSGVRVKSIRSSRLGRTVFRVLVGHQGSIDVSRSYVRIRSTAGTRYLPLKAVTGTQARAIFRLTASERRLKSKRFTYQAFLKSEKNGSMVRSPYRVIVIRAKKASPPAWRRD